MVSVAFEVKLTLGGGSVIGESNAVVLGLLCGEKAVRIFSGRYFAINSLFWARRMASQSEPGRASYFARTASLAVNRFSVQAGASVSLSSMPSSPA